MSAPSNTSSESEDLNFHAKWFPLIHRHGPNRRRGTECAVCKSGMAETDEVLQARCCDNCFHDECLEGWIRHCQRDPDGWPSCPMCRAEFCRETRAPQALDVFAAKIVHLLLDTAPHVNAPITYQCVANRECTEDERNLLCTSSHEFMRVFLYDLVGMLGRRDEYVDLPKEGILRGVMRYLETLLERFGLSTDGTGPGTFSLFLGDEDD